MPFVNVNGHRCFYRLEGHDGRPAVMLSHCLGLDHGLWDALGIETFAWCGLSMGGMIGQWLGLNAAHRVTRLVLANTTPHVSEPQAMEDRRRTVLERGMAPIETRVMERLFSPRMLKSGDPSVAWARRTLLATDPAGYAGCCAALRDFDETSRLERVTVPTLVISGDFDISMPWDHHGRLLSALIPRARDIRLPTGHVGCLERPRAFNAAVIDWLVPAPADTLSSGTAVRRAVLGDAHVDRSLAAATDFDRDFQNYITRAAWGELWTRPGLSLHTRQLLTIVMLATLNRQEELAMHLEATRNTGLPLEQVREALMHVAVYAGVPAAHAAIKTAKRVLFPPNAPAGGEREGGGHG